MHSDLRHWAKIKPILLVGATVVFVLIIEWGRLSGATVPIPFLLLYAIVVASGGAAGYVAGGLSGALAAAYVVYAAVVGFGPRTLTGGEIQVLLGMLLYVGTGLLLGRVRAQRDQFLQDTRQHEAELESEIIARTTDLRKNQEALRSSEEMFRQMAENISEVFWMTDPEKNRMIYVSPAYERIWGRSRQSLYENPLSFADAIHPEDRAAVVEALKTQEGGDYDESYRVVRPDGTVRQIRDRGFPIRNQDGDVYRVVGIATDVTEDRRRDEQLRQAQKLEVVGQLTGGVAHDFNNLLTVIFGNAELLQNRLGGEDKRLNAVLRAATRGAELTQRLLAFSRRQPLRPQAVDMGALVSDMSELLTRTLGETIDIETNAAPGLWHVSADPGQVENAVLNLALNARDAMPDGGKLTFECENVQLDAAYAARNQEAVAGDYVVLAVSDDGTGMSAEVQAHAFEPFYTTREVGQGTGLGLSMVYGFAKQSGGHVTLYSEEGRGTTMKLYLPRGGGVPRSEKARQDDDVPCGQDEAILVIEDDPDVRDLATRTLRGLGYRVIEAPDAAGARELLADGTHVDLVLSDVVLPGGTSGPEFAEEARKTRPELKVIFMSGYPAEAAKRNNLLGSDTVLLNKPFQRRQLAKALREALDLGIAE